MFKSLLIGAAVALLSAGTAFAACSDIASKVVSFTGCVDAEWVPGTGAGAQEFVYLTADQNFGLMVITEKETIPSSTFREAIIQNAIVGSGGDKDAVKVVGERIVSIDGKPFNVLDYLITSGGSSILFQNFYYSEPAYGSVQILSYSLETEQRAAAYRAGQFLASVKLGG